MGGVWLRRQRDGYGSGGVKCEYECECLCECLFRYTSRMSCEVSSHLIGAGVVAFGSGGNVVGMGVAVAFLRFSS